MPGTPRHGQLAREAQGLIDRFPTCSDRIIILDPRGERTMSTNRPTIQSNTATIAARFAAGTLDAIDLEALGSDEGMAVPTGTIWFRSEDSTIVGWSGGEDQDDPGEWATVHVGTCDPVGTVEIAARCGVSRSTVDQWRQRTLGFPAPTWTVGGRPCWNWPDVQAWLNSTGRKAQS